MKSGPTSHTRSSEETMGYGLGTRGNSSPHTKCFRMCSQNSKGMLSDNPKVGCYETDIAPTCDANAYQACYQGGLFVVRVNDNHTACYESVGCDLYNGSITGDRAATLNANTGLSANNAGPSMLCTQVTAHTEGRHNKKADVYAVDCRNAAVDSDRTCTLQAKPNGGMSLNCMPVLIYDARGKGEGGIAHADRRASRPDYGLHSPCCFQETRFGEYSENKYAETLKVAGSNWTANIIVGETE